MLIVKKLYLILISREQFNYFVILCKNVWFRAEICNLCNYNLEANEPIKMQKLL